MGSWLFSSNACNCSSCEPWTHPGAHRLVYVRRPRELNAFRKAVKTAPDSVRCSPPHPRPCTESGFRCTETPYAAPKRVLAILEAVQTHAVSRRSET